MPSLPRHPPAAVPGRCRLPRRRTDRRLAGDPPGLRHLLDAAASGAVDLLLVHRLDRLSRRMEHVEQVVEELDAASVAVRTVRKPFDSAAPANRLIHRLWAAFAEYDATSTGTPTRATARGPTPPCLRREACTQPGTAAAPRN
jgi:hypothetical protein